jgi:hypothetical protein
LAAAILPLKVDTKGLIVGTVLSVLLVSWFRPELPLILGALGLTSYADLLVGCRPNLSSEWFFPLNASLTLFGGWLAGLFGGRKAPIDR